MNFFLMTNFQQYVDLFTENVDKLVNKWEISLSISSCSQESPLINALANRVYHS